MSQEKKQWTRFLCYNVPQWLKMVKDGNNDNDDDDDK